jgi:hypothetical protein
VLAVAEGDVAPGVRALGIEAIGILEHARVAVRGADHRHQHRPGRDVDVGGLASRYKRKVVAADRGVVPAAVGRDRVDASWPRSDVPTGGFTAAEAGGHGHAAAPKSGGTSASCSSG